VFLHQTSTLLDSPTIKQPSVITINFKSLHKTIQVKFNTTDPLNRILPMVCASLDLNPETTQFKLDGIPLDWTKRAADYLIGDNETVAVHQVQPTGRPSSKEKFSSPSTMSGSVTGSLSVGEDDVLVSGSSVGDSLSLGSGGGEGNEDHITLVLRGVSNSTKFRVGKMDRFEKLRNGYCKKFGLSENQVKLMFDGETLKLNSTPSNEEMDDEDIIDVKLVNK